MTDQEILNNAPEKATHVDGDGDYWICDQDYCILVGGYSFSQTQQITMRSLADIRRIVTLEAMLHDVFLELSNANHAAQCDCVHTACESCKEHQRLQQYIADVQVEINQLSGGYDG